MAARRRFAPELRAKHGYPEITPALRAKIFGLNAAVPYKVDPKELRQFMRQRRKRSLSRR